jgi:hypothetical protein
MRLAHTASPGFRLLDFGLQRFKSRRLPVNPHFTQWQRLDFRTNTDEGENPAIYEILAASMSCVVSRIVLRALMISASFQLMPVQSRRCRLSPPLADCPFWVQFFLATMNLFLEIWRKLVEPHRTSKPPPFRYVSVTARHHCSHSVNVS